MKLEFGKFRILASDDKNFELQEKITHTPKIGSNKGNEIDSWQFRGYHSNLQSIISRLAELQVDINDDFAKIQKKLDELKKWIKKEVLPYVPKLDKTGKKGRASASEEFELTTRK